MDPKRLFLFHTELEDLTKGGLSNLKALQSATIIPAEFARAQKSYGTVEKGKIADLIMLNKNPLENITYSKTINGVILNGIYYDKGKLEELKNYTQSVASSFHMNVKVLYSFIVSPLIRHQFFCGLKSLLILILTFLSKPNSSLSTFLAR